ncbi:MAG: hypothetical protein ABR502_10500 [Chitinophagaceae bacterium]
MLPLLTKYLFRYKHVSIPHIGSLELKRKPAYLDVADKLIYPPAYSVEYHQQASVPVQQIDFFCTQLNQEHTSAESELQNFGMWMQDTLNKETFNWNGVGTFQQKEQQIMFHAEPNSSLLPPVTAQRVLRQNMQHAVLVGDREVQSNHKLESSIKTRNTTNLLIGWIFIVLAVLFITFYFFREGFKASASGSKMKVTPATYSR